MHQLDKEKTAFIISMANYYFKVMSFGLRNAGATYQRLMNRVFVDHIGTLMEIYIDDMLVKTTEDEKLLPNLETVFGYRRKHRMRLNSQKCTFAFKIEKFLGFLPTHLGIKANPDKCQVIIEMKSLTSVKEAQRLIGNIAPSPGF